MSQTAQPARAEACTTKRGEGKCLRHRLKARTQSQGNQQHGSWGCAYMYTYGCGSKSNRRGKPQVLVHVTTYQINPFWYRFVEPQPYTVHVPGKIRANCARPVTCGSGQCALVCRARDAESSISTMFRVGGRMYSVLSGTQVCAPCDVMKARCSLVSLRLRLMSLAPVSCLVTRFSFLLSSCDRPCSDSPSSLLRAIVSPQVVGFLSCS